MAMQPFLRLLSGHRIPADLNAIANDGARADQGSGSNRRVSAENRTRPDMHRIGTRVVASLVA